MITLLVSVVALAGEGEPPPVVTEVGTGLELDWTKLVLRARASSGGHGMEDTRAVEDLARRELQVGMEQGAARVPLAGEVVLGTVLEEGEVGRALTSRISRWEVTEAIYYASGRVELTAELSLQELLKPWSLSRSRAAVSEEQEPRYTGVVVDARGSGAVPAWAPQILAADGDILYDGSLWEEPAVTRSPVAYVTDPAHPASARAGATPMFVRADAASGPDLVLTADDTVRFRTAMAGARVLGEGTVVVVLDR